MILFAEKRQTILPEADDRRDHTDLKPGVIKIVSLFDMRFEIANISQRVEMLALATAQTTACEGFAQRRAVVLIDRAVDFNLGKIVDETSATEKLQEMILLVGPRADVDAEVCARLAERPRRFDAVDDAEDSVQPARVILRFAM